MNEGLQWFIGLDKSINDVLNDPCAITGLANDKVKTSSISLAPIFSQDQGSSSQTFGHQSQGSPFGEKS